TPVETVLQVLHDEPVPPGQLQPRTPRDLETICLKCLQKDPARRYGSARELAADLDRYLRGEPVTARRVGPVGRLWRWCRRNRAVAALTAGVAISLLAGAITTLFFWRRAERLWGYWQQAALRARTEEKAAREASDRAGKQLTRAEWLLYSSQLALAQREWQDN